MSKPIIERYRSLKDSHCGMINLFSGTAVYEKSFEKGDSVWDHMRTYKFSFRDSSIEVIYKKHDYLNSGGNDFMQFETFLSYKEKDLEKAREVKSILQGKLMQVRID